MDVGEPDLRISATVRSTYHILFLELKTKNGELKQSQIEWNAEFDENFAAFNCKRDVAYGYIDAQNKIKDWLNHIALE